MVKLEQDYEHQRAGYAQNKDPIDATGSLKNCDQLLRDKAGRFTNSKFP